MRLALLATVWPYPSYRRASTIPASAWSSVATALPWRSGMVQVTEPATLLPRRLPAGSTRDASVCVVPPVVAIPRTVSPVPA